MSEESRPEFGNVPERKVSLNPQVKGQKTLGLESQLPLAKPVTEPAKTIRRRNLKTARKQETQREDWEELVLNPGTRDEIRLRGRYYSIAEEATPLGLFDIPPRTGKATRLGNLSGGDKVFVVKDSEKADDYKRKGWAEVVVLDSPQQDSGEQPRLYSDGFINRLILRANYQGIIDRQAVKT